MSRHQRALVVAAALLLAACASRPPDFVYPRSPLVTASAVPTALKVNWDLGIAVVEAFIDGRGPWNFVLDTGVEQYVVDQRVADELKLERSELSSDGKGLAATSFWGGESSVRQAARIHEFRAGPLVERETGALVFDLSLLEQASGTRIDGILPATAFRDGLLTFDFAAKTVTVSAGELPPEDGKDVLALEDGPFPRIEVEIGGNPCEVLIDSGSADGLSVPSDLEASLRFRSQPTVVGRHATIAGALSEREGRLDGTIAWGRHRIADPIVSFTAQDFGVAGFELLREFRVTFDFSHSRVRFERAGSEPVRSRPVRGLGIGYLLKDGAWTVAYVLEGRPAAQAGIHVGDRVEAIDGQAISDIPYEARRSMLDTKDALRLRVVGTGGTREVTVPVATLVE